ncbi:Protein angel 1 [Sesbania bispinosa]|nr:Protein angel 1 [Sesbania bispinosa]
MCKDPYFVTTASKKAMKPESHHEGQSSAAVANCPAEGPKGSPLKEVASSKGVNSPTTYSAQLNAPQVVVPLSFMPPPTTTQSLLVSGATPLSSLLPEEDACMLREFFERHPGFLVPDSGLPPAFLKPAYALFSDLLCILPALEDLNKVSEATRLLEQCVTELQEHFKAVKTELDRSVAELDCLRAKEKEIKDARASLDTILDF